jgi:hypothetical protein
MPHSSLIARLKNHEDNFVERKPEGVNASEIRQSVIAFANSVPVGTTAVLFMGIHNDGRIQGVENPDKLQKTVREQCERVCYPPVAFSTAVLDIEGKAVVAVVVPPSQNKPHFSGPAFVRRGSESVAASPELFEELIASRNDKVAAIFRMRNALVSVICIQHKLGSTEQIADTRYRALSECVVESCTPHIVRLKDIGSDRYVTEPIENVAVSYDEERHRPMLIVRG